MVQGNNEEIVNCQVRLLAYIYIYTSKYVEAISFSIFNATFFISWLWHEKQNINLNESIKLLVS